MDGVLIMDLSFNKTLSQSYKSNSQKTRVMSEAWVKDNMYCPCCGNLNLNKIENNKPVSDFQCGNCGEIYELKSKKRSIGKKITDGAYSTMIEHITNNVNTDLFVLVYLNFEVDSLYIIPKFFFTPGIIERRKPLAQTAKRAGWIGCNILFEDIPEQGKIQIIKNQDIINSEDVISEYKKLSELKTENIENRSWLFDIMNCVNQIPQIEFTLNNVYQYTELLKLKHINNNNIEAKIRQQLQILRNKGFIEFLSKGQYRKRG